MDFMSQTLHIGRQYHILAYNYVGDRMKFHLHAEKCHQHTFFLDEFFSKPTCVTPKNSPIDDWMSFPVKRSPKFSRNLLIRVELEIKSIDLDAFYIITQYKTQ